MNFTHIKDKKKINMVDVTKKKKPKKLPSARALVKFTRNNL